MAFPRETLDQDDARIRHALPREWFTHRAFLRLSALAAREFKVDRRALRGCSAILVLPHSNLLRGNTELLLRLRRMMTRNTSSTSVHRCSPSVNTKLSGCSRRSGASEDIVVHRRDRDEGVAQAHRVGVGEAGDA